MPKSWNISVALLALAMAAPRLLWGGSVVLTDGTLMVGTVTLVAGGEGNISVKVAGKPARNYPFARVQTALFDSLASPDAPASEDGVPWARVQLGEIRRPRIAEIKGDTITIKDATEAFRLGQRERDEQSVAGTDRSFVFQKLEWDGEIIARMVPLPNTATTSSGLMICEGLGDDGPMVLVSREVDRKARLTARSAHGEDENLVSSPRANVTQAAPWLKLSRTWDTLRAYESVDGAAWSPVGECRVEMDDKKGVYIGVVAAFDDDETAAGFDHVKIRGRRSAAVLPGGADPRMSDMLVRLSDGTILTGMLKTAADGKSTLRKIGGDFMTVPSKAIASAQFGPLSPEETGRVAAITAGALTRDGDFLEGEIKDFLDDKVTVSSVNFGLTTLTRHRVIFLAFQAMPAPEPRLLAIRLQDGSLVMARTLAVEKDQLVIQEPLLGTLKLPVRDVMSLDHRP